LRRPECHFEAGRIGADAPAPHGRLLLALTVTVARGKITGYELIAEPARLARLELGVPDT
jgi:RNA polymerase sigma-70 factor (ECF subfamily)